MLNISLSTLAASPLSPLRHRRGGRTNHTLVDLERLPLPLGRGKKGEATS